MLSQTIRVVWDEPRVPPPTAVPWWDRALVVTLVPATIAEGLLRDDVPWAPYTVGLTVVVVLAILGRARAPLAMTLLAFVAQTVAGLGPVLAGRDYGVLYVTACVLLFPYSLGRWARGRDVVVGMALLVLLHVVREPLYGESVANIVLGAGFLLLPAALGAAVRFWRSSRERERSEIRLREREQLSRELHDTVAHHVSGIVIQAQAGRAVSKSDPTRAVEALTRIETAATQTMAEMRSMVGVLRDDTKAQRAPASGLGDLERLVRGQQGPAQAVLHTDGDLSHVGSSVEGVVYRLVQESLTNVRLHARNATRIEVWVVGDSGDEGSMHTQRDVRVTVTDNGRPAARGRRQGYGLVGMNERVQLLGGTLQAGPRRGTGWCVAATIPLSREVR